MKTRYIFLLLAVLFFRETCPAQRKAALVIGNASYADVPLRNPANDATDMAATLRELGFTVTLKTNLNKQGMETAVGSFTAGLAPGDIALFFYSGHGMQVSGSNYLIPVNEAIGNETDVRYKAMDAQYVMDYMQDARTSVNIIILDACRDNPYRGYKSQTKGFIAVSAPQGTFIAYSTGPGKIAADGTGRNSPYTRNLISCMKMPDIEIEDAFKEVRKKVMSETGNQQVPWESSSLVQAFAFKGMATKPGPVPTGPIITREQPIVQVGSLKLTTEIAGALYVDSVLMRQVNANTVLTIDKLTEGSHTVKISGDETAEKEVTISAGETANLTLDKRRSEASSLVPEMVFIQGGTFQMGSNEGDDDEKPVHTVTVGSFYMGKYEVTVAQFRQFINDAGYQTDADKDGGSYIWTGKWEKRSGVNWKCDAEGNIRPQSEYNHPVIHVSWNDATEYCNWLSRKTGKNYRLPTEGEWEYAAGNGTRHTKYSWGNGDPYGKAGGNVADESLKRKYSDGTIFSGYDDGYIFTAPVGSFNPNDFGLHDMTGNVWEWCKDWYGGDFYKTSPAIEPKGPSTGSGRVNRGGSWNFEPAFQRVAFRYGYFPSGRFGDLGFRLARTD
jgi:formylglycine-generating enzyme required for sulfatase activity